MLSSTISLVPLTHVWPDATKHANAAPAEYLGANDQQLRNTTERTIDRRSNIRIAKYNNRRLSAELRGI
jgi:hypothetical protein